MLDWMTLTIEAIGIVILCVWTVLPVQEFKQILVQIHKRDRNAGPQQSGGPDSSQ